MWFFYLLLTIGSSQGQSDIRISGSGKIVPNGQTTLDIHVEMANPGAAGVVAAQGPKQLPTGTGTPPIRPAMKTGTPPIRLTPPTRPTMNTGTPPIQPTMSTGKTPVWPAKSIGKPPIWPAKGAGKPPIWPAKSIGKPTIGPTKSTGTPQSGPTTGQGAGTGAFNQEEEAGLAKHNEFRQIHAAPPMTLNRQMCDQAKAYAKKIAAMGALMHSKKEERDGQGENLSMGCSTNLAQSMEEAVTNWYNEICDPGYDFASGGFAGGTGHFTQVVWKESTELGIGRAESVENGMKCAYIVGRYKPAGNMMGDFPKNVAKGSFNQRYCDSVKDDQTKPKFFASNRSGAINEKRVTKVDAPEFPDESPDFSRKLMILKKKKNFVGSSKNL